MELLRPSNVHDVVEAWVRAEMASARFGPRLRELLARDGLKPSALDDPRIRLQLLTEFRGSGVGSPAGPIDVEGLRISDLTWWHALVPRAELDEIRYICWGYWLETTQGTRRPSDFLRHVRQSKDESSGPLADLVAEIRSGKLPPPMILVDSGPGTRIVVMEGHLRLSAYVMAGFSAPDRIDVLFGRSPAVAEWSDY